MAKKTRRCSNENLIKAKKTKNDEYYTRKEDVEKELAHYSDHFNGKSVYLCCDSPRASAFWSYFSERFAELGLSKLVATHYFNGKDTEATVWESVDGKVVRYTIPLVGKGDFRSPECRAFMEAADIVVTNPPFSLIRKLIATIDEIGVDYLLIAPNTILTCKTVLRMIQEGRCRSGVHEVKKFEIAPGEYKNVPAYWITSLDHGVAPHAPSIEAPASDYRRYTNVDAVDVPFVKQIPEGYYGTMGVPTSFFPKWNPEEFEIVGVEQHAKLRLDDGTEEEQYARILIRRKGHARHVRTPVRGISSLIMATRASKPTGLNVAGLQTPLPEAGRVRGKAPRANRRTLPPRMPQRLLDPISPTTTKTVLDAPEMPAMATLPNRIGPAERASPRI